MPLSNIKQVFETTKWETANEYLDLGWILLDVYHQAEDVVKPWCDYQKIYYSLGWLKESNPVHPENPYTRWCDDEIL